MKFLTQRQNVRHNESYVCCYLCTCHMLQYGRVVFTIIQFRLNLNDIALKKYSLTQSFALVTSYNVLYNIHRGILNSILNSINVVALRFMQDLDNHSSFTEKAKY